MKCIVKFCIIITIFFTHISEVVSQHLFTNTQNTFIKYLDNNQLWEDKIVFLKQTVNQNVSLDDTLQLLLAESFFRLNKYDSALFYFSKCNNSYLIKHNRYKLKIGLLLQTSDTLEVKKILNNLIFSDSSFRKESKLLFSIIDNHFNNFSKDSLNQVFPFDIVNHILAHQKVLSKKTSIAVILSMLIPGLGKVYLGRKKEGFNMMALNLATGSMAIESLMKKGILSIYTIPSVALFSVFYLGNIYGTYKAVNKHKNDSYKELLYDIGVHYSSN